MVILHVKRGEESLFLLEAGVLTGVGEVLDRVTHLHNARLKVLRVCSGLEQLADYGPSLPLEMQGLLEEQLADLNLKDDSKEECVASGGEEENKDPTGRRRGKKPTEKMRKVLLDTVQEAKAVISKELVKCGTPFTPQHPQEALAMLGGAVGIVYPAGLPPQDPVRQEMENREILKGTQDEKMVLDPATTQLWFASKELQCDKKLKDYLGSNEKTKVIIKVQRRGQGAPSREPQLSPEQQKILMMKEYRRREEIKSLVEDSEDTFLDSSWSNPHQLHQAFQGIGNVSWKPR